MFKQISSGRDLRAAVVERKGTVAVAERKGAAVVVECNWVATVVAESERPVAVVDCWRTVRN